MCTIAAKLISVDWASQTLSAPRLHYIATSSGIFYLQVPSRFNRETCQGSNGLICSIVRFQRFPLRRGRPALDNRNNRQPYGDSLK